MHQEESGVKDRASASLHAGGEAGGFPSGAYSLTLQDVPGIQQPFFFLFFSFSLSCNQVKVTLAERLWALHSGVSFPKITTWSGALMKALDVSKFIF